MRKSTGSGAGKPLLLMILRETPAGGCEAVTRTKPAPGSGPWAPIWDRASVKSRELSPAGLRTFSPAQEGWTGTLLAYGRLHEPHPDEVGQDK